MDDQAYDSLVESFERIADALTGIYDVQKKRFAKDFPEHREPRHATVTRVLNDEDKRREAQGHSNTPIKDWLSDLPARDVIGPREKAFIEAEEAKKRDAVSKTVTAVVPSGGSYTAAGSQAERTGAKSADNAPPEAS